MIVKQIRSDWIKVEMSYRHDLPDKKLSEDILLNRLQAPLIVEEIKKNQEYILIEGHRRFHSLKSLGYKKMYCKIEPATDELQKGIKRLRLQFRTKKATGYELERLILYLTDLNMSTHDIASEIGVTRFTIEKHIKSKDVPVDLKETAEKRKVGKDNITKLYYIDVIPPRLKSRLLTDCMNKVIRRNEVGAILKTAKVPLFSQLSENLMNSAINEATKIAKFQKQDAEDIVYLQACRDKRLVALPEVHTFGSRYFISELQRLVPQCYPWLTEQFTPTERQAINNLLREFSSAVNTVYWSDFPKGFRSKETSKDPN